MTALRVFDRGRLVGVDAVPTGRIAEVQGWSAARIGDRFGAGPGDRAGHGSAGQFPRPSLETVVTAVHPQEVGAMYAALSDLADPPGTG